MPVNPWEPWRTSKLNGCGCTSINAHLTRWRMLSPNCQSCSTTMYRKKCTAMRRLPRWPGCYHPLRGWTSRICLTCIDKCGAQLRANWERTVGSSLCRWQVRAVHLWQISHGGKRPQAFGGYLEEAHTDCSKEVATHVIASAEIRLEYRVQEGRVHVHRWYTQKGIPEARAG